MPEYNSSTNKELVLVIEFINSCNSRLNVNSIFFRFNLYECLVVGGALILSSVLVLLDNKSLKESLGVLLNESLGVLLSGLLSVLLNVPLSVLFCVTKRLKNVIESSLAISVVLLIIVFINLWCGLDILVKRLLYRLLI